MRKNTPSLKEKYAKENEPNILFSLEYLAKEAKRSGHNDLHSILRTALNLAYNKNGLIDASFLVEQCDDTQRIINFLFRFVESPEDVQKRIVSIIEGFEIEEDQKH